MEGLAPLGSGGGRQSAGFRLLHLADIRIVFGAPEWCSWCTLQLVRVFGLLIQGPRPHVQGMVPAGNGAAVARPQHSEKCMGMHEGMTAYVAADPHCAPHLGL